MIDSLKMYKISDEVIRYIENTMENMRVERTVGGKSLAEVKIKWGIFQGDALSPFVMAMMPVNNIFMKYTSDYKHHKSQEKSTT